MSHVIDKNNHKTTVVSIGTVKELIDNTTPIVTESQDITWNDSRKPAKTTFVNCIIIDKRMRWHDNIKLDLHGIDTHGFTWNYYGFWYPVFVEKDKKLIPFYSPDVAGESPNKLYIAAKSFGYKDYMRVVNNMLQKIAIGLMAAIVLGIFFLIFILINQ